MDLSLLINIVKKKKTHTHTHLIFGPGVGIGEQPGGGDSRTLLGANLQRADHWDAVIITCRQRKETSDRELKLSQEFPATDPKPTRRVSLCGLIKKKHCSGPERHPAGPHVHIMYCTVLFNPTLCQGRAGEHLPTDRI